MAVEQQLDQPTIFDFGEESAPLEVRSHSDSYTSARVAALRR